MKKLGCVANTHCAFDVNFLSFLSLRPDGRSTLQIVDSVTVRASVVHSTAVFSP